MTDFPDHICRISDNAIVALLDSNPQRAKQLFLDLIGPSLVYDILAIDSSILIVLEENTGAGLRKIRDRVESIVKRGKKAVRE